MGRRGALTIAGFALLVAGCGGGTEEGDDPGDGTSSPSPTASSSSSSPTPTTDEPEPSPTVEPATGVEIEIKGCGTLVNKMVADDNEVKP